MVAAAAMRFQREGPVPAIGVDMRLLINTNGYDVRRVLAGPSERHGPGRYGGDALVCLLAGDLTFEVSSQSYDLGPGDLLWVPAGAWRGFVSGPQGAELIAIHLPVRE